MVRLSDIQPIDSTKPVIHNEDGTFSTELTIGIEADGKFLNIPTIVKGEELSAEEAIFAFERGQNEPVGVFNTRKERDDAAKDRSVQLGIIRVVQPHTPISIRLSEIRLFEETINEPITPEEKLGFFEEVSIGFDEALARFPQLVGRGIYMFGKTVAEEPAAIFTAEPLTTFLKIKPKTKILRTIGERIMNVGLRLNAKTELSVKRKFPQEVQNKFARTLGAGVSSLGASIGLGMSFGPAAAGLAFGGVAFTEGFFKADQKGKDFDDSLRIGSLKGLTEGSLEFVGISRILRSQGGVLLRIIKGSVVEGTTEFAQEIGSGVIDFGTGLEEFKGRESVVDLLSQATLAASVGAVLGGAVSIPVTIAQKKGIEQGLRELGATKEQAIQVSDDIMKKGIEEVVAAAEIESEKINVANEEFAEVEGVLEEGVISPEEVVEGIEIVRERAARAIPLTKEQQIRFPELAETARQIAITQEKIREAKSKEEPISPDLHRKRNQLIESLGLDPKFINPKSSEVKTAIRESTGQLFKEAKTITESKALKRSLQRQQQVARQAALLEKRKIQESQKLIRQIKKAPIQDMAAQERVEIEKLKQELKITKTLDGLRVLNNKVQRLKEEGKKKFIANKEARMERRALDKQIVLETILKGQELKKEPRTRATKERINAFKAIRLIALRPQRIFDFLDGFQDFKGPIHEILYNRVNRAFTEEVRNTRAFTNKGIDILAKNKILSEELTQSIDIEGVALTFEEMMYIYVASNNEESLSAIVFGNRIPADVVDRIINDENLLPQKFKNAADEIASELTSNYDRSRVAMLEFSDGKTDLGRVANVYIPLRRINEDNETTDQELLNELSDRTEFRKAFAQRGFTKDRKKISSENQTPSRMDLMGIYFDHVAKREHFIAMGSLIKDMQALINDKDVAQAIRQEAGKEMLTTVRNYTNRVANPNVYRAFTAIEKFASVSRQSAAVVHLGWNMVTMLKQVPSVVLFLGEVGPIDLINGVTQSVGNFTETTNFINERDAQMANRNIERELEELRIKDPKRYDRIILKIKKTSFNGIRFFDRIAVNAGWIAKYNQMIRRGFSEQEAIEEARNTVLRTQPAAATKDLAELYATNEFLNLFTQFTNQLNQIWNIVTFDIPARFRKGRIDTAILGGIGVSLNAIIIWSITNARAPEDEEDYAQAALQIMLSTIPLIGPMANSWRQGFDGLPPVAQVAKSGLIEIPRNIYKIIREEKDEKRKKAFQRALDDSLELGAFVAGVPFTQIKRTVIGVTDLITGREEDRDIRRLIFSRFVIDKANRKRENRGIIEKKERKIKTISK